MADYREHSFRSADGGLELFARDYPGANGSSPALLLIHALTRNSADFEPLIEWLAGTYRLVVPDVRGRGRSEWDSDPMRYRPDVYGADMFALMDDLGIESAGVVGTSMGGLIAMAMAAIAEGTETGSRLGPVVLNDVGAQLEPKALARIGNYVGKDRRFADWDAAAADTRSVHGAIFPDFSDEDWMAFARRTCREVEGDVRHDYDPAISVPIAAGEGEDEIDLWPIWACMKERPVLVIRGAMSDLITADTVAEMGRRHAGPFAQVEVPMRGHTPMLDEPAAKSALSDFLKEHYPA